MGESLVKNTSNFSLVVAVTLSLEEQELSKHIARLLQNEFELQVELRRVRQQIDQAYNEKRIFWKNQKI
jgi:hypothetical protein